jgi:hypothetical protein
MQCADTQSFLQDFIFPSERTEAERMQWAEAQSLLQDFIFPSELSGAEAVFAVSCFLITLLLNNSLSTAC